jgi:hypothetical protein
VAGIGFDLASRLTCSEFKYRMNTAESEYPRVLHYFDCVVMEGPAASKYRKAILEGESWDAMGDALEQDVAPMLYLRRTGLANYIVFAKRADCFCENCSREAARKLELEVYQERLSETATLRCA